MLCMLALLLAACGPNPAEKELAWQIRSDRSLQQVDSMARAVIRQGLTAGSGYSQVWIRDLNTFIEVACEEMEPAVLREAILLFFALQQPNGEMIDGYVLKPDFTWEDDSPYYSDAAPDHVAFKNTVETDQESSLIQTVGKYVRRRATARFSTRSSPAAACGSAWTRWSTTCSANATTRPTGCSSAP